MIQGLPRPKRLVYLPCEKYDSRWTEIVSGSDGIFETQCKGLGVDVLAIRPHDYLKTIEQGQVLDPVTRTEWSFAQMRELVSMISRKKITLEDVVYFEDMWTGGFEMLPYAAQVCLSRRIPTYAFCHAQSVDPNDFTYPMKWWMRDIERGWAKYLAGIFVAAEELEAMLLQADVAPNNVHVTGTVFSAQALYKIRPSYGLQSKPFTVIFSSRWDKEKDPGFFMDLVEKVLAERMDVVFKVCTGAKELRSNEPALVSCAQTLAAKYPRQFIIQTGLTKEMYYRELATAKVQFNCADQDFVSYTLLEAAVYGAAPLYPNYLTFPDALHNKKEHLYEKGNVEDAITQLYKLLNVPNIPSQDYSWVYKKYESSVHRMLKVMGFDVPQVHSLANLIYAGRREAQQ